MTEQIGLRLNEQTKIAFDQCDKRGLSTTGFISQLINNEWKRQEAEQNRIKTLTDYQHYSFAYCKDNDGLAAKIAFTNFEKDASLIGELIDNPSFISTMRYLLNVYSRANWDFVLSLLPERLYYMSVYAKPVLNQFRVMGAISANYLYDGVVIPANLLDAVATAEELHRRLAEVCIYSYKRHYDQMAINKLAAEWDKAFGDNSSQLLDIYKSYSVVPA